MFEPVDIRDHLEHARWKISCINWTSDPDVPRATVYLWDAEHEMMLVSTYLPTVADAIAYVSAILPRFRAAVADGG